MFLVIDLKRVGFDQELYAAELQLCLLLTMITAITQLQWVSYIDNMDTSQAYGFMQSTELESLITYLFNRVRKYKISPILLVAVCRAFLKCKRRRLRIFLVSN